MIPWINGVIGVEVPFFMINTISIGFGAIGALYLTRKIIIEKGVTIS